MVKPRKTPLRPQPMKRVPTSSMDVKAFNEAPKTHSTTGTYTEEESGYLIALAHYRTEVRARHNRQPTEVEKYRLAKGFILENKY